MVAALAIQPEDEMAPFTIGVDTPLGSVGRTGGLMSIKVEVTNGTNHDWHGSVRLSVVGGTASGRVRGGNFAGRPLTLKAGRTRTVTFRGEQPAFTGLYTVTATVYDTVDRASGIGWVSV